MGSVQNDNAPAAPLLSPPTTAGSNPAVGSNPHAVPPPGSAAAAAPVKTFSGGAESQAQRGGGTARRSRHATESRTSRYRGVQWDRTGGRWRARLHTDRTRHIGYFEVEEEAAMAWDLAVLRYFGEVEGKKKLNFGDASIARYRAEPNAQFLPINAKLGLPGHRPSKDAPTMPAFRGVLPHEGGTFRAVVMRNRVNSTVGVYATAEEAARAHDCAAIETNGWGTLTNFPLSDYQADSNGKPVLAATARGATAAAAAAAANGAAAAAAQQIHVHAYAQQHSAGLPPLGMLRRQASLPAAVPPRDHAAAAQHALMRSASQSSAEFNGLMGHRSSSVPNLHHLAATTWHPAASAGNLNILAAPGAYAPQPQQHHMHLAQPLTAPAGTVYATTGGLVTIAAQQPTTVTQPSEARKRLRSSPEEKSGQHGPSPSHGTNGTGGGTDGANGLAGTEGTPGGSGGSGSPGVAAAGSPGSAAAADNAVINAVSGVRQLADGSFQAALFLDLGTYLSYDEAVRAYDRAAIVATGFTAPTHVPLPEAIARAAAAAGGGPPQLVPASAGAGPPPRFRGVVRRGGAFLAALDVGGKAYELGPFATEIEAAKAYDKYTLMLRGVAAATNFPPWEHLATPAEVSALVEAVGVAAAAAAADAAPAPAPAPVLATPQATLALAGVQPAALPLLSPLVHANSDAATLARTASQMDLAVAQAQAHAHAAHAAHQAHQAHQAQQMASVLSVQPMGQAYSMHSMPATMPMGGIDPATIAVHSSLVRMPSSGNLALPLPGAGGALAGPALPVVAPTVSVVQQAPSALPAATVGTAAAPTASGQAEVGTAAAAAGGALAAAAQLEQQLTGTTPMAFQLPATSQAMLAGAQSVVVTAPATAVTGGTLGRGGATQDTAAAGGGVHQQQQQQQAPSASVATHSAQAGPTPPVSGLEVDLGGPGGGWAQATAAAAAAAATAAADAAVAAVTPAVTADMQTAA